jgi:PHP family Zn ribbon phosphoesterase
MTLGNRFCKVDLHVHTPKSECFLEKEVTPEMIVNQAIASGMNAIAITDHNTAEWIDSVKNAASGTGLVVFPGVEITIQPGVHVVAIFSEDRTSSHVTDLLTDLGLKTDDRGKNNSLVTKFSVQEVVSKIRNDHHALPILAHIDNEKGAWKVLRNHGQTLLQLWQAKEFAAVEITGESLPEEIGRDPFLHIPAYYWASDNPHPEFPEKHSLSGIGVRYSRFKLSEPITWEGLRLCFHDPEMRIRPASDETISHPRIEEVSIEGGFLSNTKIELTPNLNCVIGGRGTGKSCLLELLRYVFDAKAKTDINNKQFQELILNTFTAGSRITVRFKVDQGMTYRIERTVNQPPKLFREGSDQSLDIAPTDLLPIQVYGQKEVFEISKDPTFQLKLFDNYLADSLKPLLGKENDLLRQLGENAEKITRLEDEISEIEQQVGKMGAVEEEIHRMEDQDFVNRLQVKSQYDQEFDLLNDIQTQFLELENSLAAFSGTNSLNYTKLEDEKIDELPNKQLFLELRIFAQEVNKQLETSLITLQNRIDGLWRENQTDRVEWQADFEKQNDLYNELLRVFQAEGKLLKPERYVELKAEHRKLRQFASENEVRKGELNTQWSQRTALLVELRKNRREQYETRRQKALRLTQALGGKIRITIWPQGHRKNYQEKLDKLFEGTRARKDIIDSLANAKSETPEQEAQRPGIFRGETRFIIPEIPFYLDQIELAEAVRQEQRPNISDSETPLKNKFGIASEKMRQNLASLSSEKLFELEIFDIPDLPVIELQVGSGVFGYKPLNSLSVGQKCTALLSLVLFENPAPLIIDQPEDDLDNHFIFDQIVTTLRKAKERRQFIIATHNANIPVSGDAELILVLQADDQRGWIDEDCIGSIDSEPIKQSVEKILEGGEVAFKIRKEKYGI